MEILLTPKNARIGSKITYKQSYNRYLETGGKPFSNGEHKWIGI